MKELKCPLCGGTPEYILEEGDGICEYAGCPKCGLYAAPSWGDWNCNPSKEATWQRWRDLVSKFPPIMRVEQGDNLKLTYADDVSTVVDKDLSRMRIFVQTVYGNIERVSCEEVEKWPWELKQEGGTEQ